MKAKFYVQFAVKRNSRGEAISVAAKALTKGPPAMRFDGACVGFEVDLPAAAFAVQIIRLDVPLERIGLPSSSRRSVRAWVTRVRQGRRVKRRLRAVAA